MKTWDLKKLVKEVIYNYVMSLNDMDNLKRPISAFTTMYLLKIPSTAI